MRQNGPHNDFALGSWLRMPIQCGQSRAITQQVLCFSAILTSSPQQNAKADQPFPVSDESSAANSQKGETDSINICSEVIDFSFPSSKSSFVEPLKQVLA